MSAPRLVVVVELERGAWAYADVANDGEEARLLFDLAGRNLVRELLDAMHELVERMGDVA